MVSPESVAERLKTAFPDARIQVRAEEGRPDHLFARIASTAFEGKSLVQQHRLVYAALADKLSSGELHALALKTFLLSEWMES